MINENIFWTDLYEVIYPTGIIKMYISSYKDGNFLGTVLYDESLISGDDFQQWKIEQYLKKTEEEAYDNCDLFINKTLRGKGGYNIEKKSRMKS